MTTIEVLLSVGYLLLFVLHFVHVGDMKVRDQVIHNRVNALADESARKIKEVESNASYLAKNAQNIASNALSSAQRAESKVKNILESK